MKIAMLGVKSVPAIGGIAHYVEEVGSRLVERGHDVTVYCRPQYIEGNGEYRGMRRVITPGMRGKHLDAPTHTLTAAFHAACSKFDVVHFHGSAPAAFAPLSRVLGRQKVLLTIHGLDWQGAKWGSLASTLMRGAGRVAATSVQKIVAVSRSVSEQYAQVVPCSISVVPTGVDFPELAEPREILEMGLEPGEYVFTASRLMPEKGLHRLVAAWESIETDKTLVIAGNAPYEDEYTRELLSHASKRVRFLGYVKGRLLAELFSNAYLYVQPSELEGLSIAVLEALSYGRCVLASDIAANCEALGPCGYTFRSADVLDLWRSLRALLESPEAVAAQFIIAREHVRRQRNWDTTVDAYECLYEDLLVGRTVFPADQPDSSPAASAARRRAAV